MTGARAAARFALLAAALAACDDGAPPARGFGSRQLLPVRDADLAFQGGWDNLVLYSSGSDSPRYWSMDIESGEIREHDAEYSDLSPGIPVGTNGRYSCSLSGLAGVHTLIVVDRQTTQETVVVGIVGPITRCPSEADPTLSMWRLDDAGRLALWTGPFDALQPAQLDTNIVPRQLLELGPQVTYLLAAAPENLDAFGLYRIELATFAVTLMIPATLADAAWAPGTTPDGPLESSTVSHKTSVVREPQWSTLGDRFIYERTMSDGSVTIFAGPFDPPAARELALFHVRTDTSLARLRLSSPRATGDLPGLAAWREHDATGASSLVHVWQDELRRLVSCPLTAPFEIVGSTTTNRRHLLVFPRPADYEVGIPITYGPVVLVSPDAVGTDGSGGCVDIATERALSAGFSPDGTALSWLVEPTPGVSEAELWAAAADGSARRLLGRGDIRFAQFIGPSQLELSLGADLAWLDVHDDPVRMHYVADDIFGSPIVVGRWLVTGYQRNHQDGNGRLGVVSRDTGEMRVISPEVVGYTTPDRDPYARTTLLDRPVRVVYLVRGRNPSPQDGIWVATVDRALLP